MQRISNYFDRIFSLDLRSLGLFRFILGAVCAIDAFSRLLQLNDFYTDSGLVTRSYFLEHLSHPWSYSFHLISGESWAIGFLFIIHLAVAISFMLGYRTKLTNFLLWLFVISVHNRFWYVNNGGDDVMRILLFFCLFLPIGHYFSVDGISKDKPKTHTSFWTFSFVLQISFVYMFSYALKDGQEWRSLYNATYIAFQLDIFNNSISKFLLNFPDFLKVLTAFIIYAEGFGSLVLLFSFSQKLSDYCRYLAVLIFVGLHIGIICTLSVGLFPYVCISMWLAMLPSSFWDKYFINKNSIKIYYDNNCGFCRKMVFAIKDVLHLENTIIAPQTVNFGVEALMEKENSWVVMANGKTFFRFDGIIALLEGSKLLSPIGLLLSLKPFHILGTFIYKFVANNRLSFSLFSSKIQLSFSKTVIKNHPVIETFGLVVLMAIINWNLGEIKKLKYNKAPQVFTLMRYLHLYQNWGMFSPHPQKLNSWFVFEGELANGQKYDYFSNSSIYDFEKPKDIKKYIKSKEWRKLFLNMEGKELPRELYARYLCRHVNHQRGVYPKDKLRILKLYTLSLNVDPELKDKKNNFSKKVTWKHYCFEKDWKEQKALKELEEDSTDDVDDDDEDEE